MSYHWCGYQLCRQVKEQGTQVWDNFRAGSPDIEEGMHEAEPWIGGVPAVNGLSWRREHEAEKHAKKTREVEGRLGQKPDESR